MWVQRGYVHTDMNHLVFVIPCQNVSSWKMVETTIRYQLNKPSDHAELFDSYSIFASVEEAMSTTYKFIVIRLSVPII